MDLLILYIRLAMFIARKILLSNCLKDMVGRQLLSTTSTSHACNRVGYSRILGRQYLRVYPTLFVYPDGSTITIRYKEPRQIISLPLNLKEVDEATRVERLSLRKRSKKVDVTEEEIADEFDAREYRHLWQGKKRMGGKS